MAHVEGNNENLGKKIVMGIIAFLAGVGSLVATVNEMSGGRLAGKGTETSGPVDYEADTKSVANRF